MKKFVLGVMWWYREEMKGHLVEQVSYPKNQIEDESTWTLNSMTSLKVIMMEWGMGLLCNWSATSCLVCFGALYYNSLRLSWLLSSRSPTVTFYMYVLVAKQPFWVIAFLRRFCQTCLFRHELDHPAFTSLDFTIIIIFDRARSSALRPTPNLQYQVSVFVSPSDRVAQLYP
jgi:hypothetical protein